MTLDPYGGPPVGRHGGRSGRWGFVRGPITAAQEREIAAAPTVWRRPICQAVAWYQTHPRPGSLVHPRWVPVQWLVDLFDGHLDTGLFADHRETRARVRAESRGRRFLNLFGYTGSFTCAAAAGGAAATTTVDRSATYLRRARENLERNRLWSPRHELVRDDAEPFLARARRAGRSWELCLLDPPSFSTGRGAPPFDVQRDHRALVERTLGVLAPGGVLYFSTNHQRFEPRLAGLAAEVREITDETIPEDYRNRTIHRCWRLVQVS